MEPKPPRHRALRLIVMVQGVLLAGGLVFMAALLPEVFTVFTQAKTSSLCTVPQEIHMKSDGVPHAVAMEGDTIQVITRHDNGTFRLIRTDLCTGEKLADSVFVIENKYSRSN